MLRDFSRIKACVIGAGRSGLGATRLLLQKGAQVVIVDDGNKEQVEAKAKRYGGLPQEAFWMGSVAAPPLDTDICILSPGVSRSHSVVKAAAAMNIPILNEIELAAGFLPNCRWVGVTGTNGKSTTTTMLGSILQQMDPFAFVGGNLGPTLCEAVYEEKYPQLGVLELSSFQLETLTHLTLKVALITNLSPDHLDRYPSVEAYYQAKKRIFGLLDEEGAAVLFPSEKPKKEAERFYQGPRKVHFWQANNTVQNPHIVGLHNFENSGAAWTAAQALGIPESFIAKGLEAYEGIAHRLELIGEVKGIRFVNDSKATNVEAAIMALRSFETGIHLIAGGVGKGSSYQPMVEESKGRVKGVYVIGSDAPLLKQAYEGDIPVYEAGKLDAAVRMAFSRALKGDVILLAPACASYDQFMDYAHRGETFKQLYEEASRGCL